MDFYQQKYFQPYRKVNRDPLPSPSHRSFERTYARESQYYDSPSKQDQQTPEPMFERSPMKSTMHVRMTTQPIWEYLYNEGRKTQQEILAKHNHNKNKIDLECTFQPLLRHNKRYLIHSSSNFIERNTLWNQNKIEKKVKEKEDQVYSDLKQCTFKPKINPNNKKQSQYSRSPLKHDRSQKQLKDRNRYLNPYYSPFKDKAKPNQSPSPLKERNTKTNYQMLNVHKLIKKELKRINI